MKTKIDLEKFVRSLMERYYEKIHIDPTTTRCWLDRVLEDQGLEYKDGEIVEIEQESEDEKIRKELIDYINRLTVSPNNIDRYNSWIAWLENQGEDKKEINNFDVLPGLYKCIHRMFDGTPEGRLLFEVGNVYKCISKHDRAEFEVSYGHSIYLEDPVVCKHFIPFEKQSEKPKWGEEDEHRVKDTIYFLDTAKKHYASIVELDACIDWLKSIRQRMEE